MHLPPVWRISACAALLGLGQNGLLVALPVLVARFGLPLSQWAGLILLGSMLFLVGSPFWGRVADRRGARFVVMQALAGYGFSFALIAVALWLSAEGALPTTAMLALLALARVLYGLTVSGMVPACQQWALTLHADEERVAALAAVSAGLSTGRLLGPLIAAASLSLSAYAPFAMMLLGALLALALLWGVPRPVPEPRAPTQAASLLPAPGNLPYLGMALLLAMSVALMQLGLPAALQQSLTVDATRAGHLMGLLLSLGALGALGVQLGVIRSRRVGGHALLALGGVGLALGYALLAQTGALAGFIPGVLIASIGAALAVPGYTEAATRHQAQGASAGFLGMAHTLGYGGATLAVSLFAAPHLLHLALLAALLLLTLLPLARRRYRALEAMPLTNRD